MAASLEFSSERYLLDAVARNAAKEEDAVAVAFMDALLQLYAHNRRRMLTSQPMVVPGTIQVVTVRDGKGFYVSLRCLDQPQVEQDHGRSA